MEDKEVAYEQYKLYVELMDRTSERRHKTNSYFLSLNVFLVSLLGIISSTGLGQLKLGWAFFTSAAGIILCYYWYRLVRSYKDLNTGKFSSIHKIEEGLPLQLFKDEWEELGEGKDPKKYLPFTHIEMNVPWVFAGLYGILFLWTVLETFCAK